jgi:hypothetical protein
MYFLTVICQTKFFLNINTWFVLGLQRYLSDASTSGKKLQDISSRYQNLEVKNYKIFLHDIKILSDAAYTQSVDKTE